jgi:hypothetical protein
MELGKLEFEPVEFPAQPANRAAAMAVLTAAENKRMSFSLLSGSK